MTVEGRAVDLSPREFSLLECFLRHPGPVADPRPAARPGVAVLGRGDPERGRRLRPLPAHEARRGRPLDRDGARRRATGWPMADGDGRRARRRRRRPSATRGRRRPAHPARPLAPRRVERRLDARWCSSCSASRCTSRSRGTLARASVGQLVRAGRPGRDGLEGGGRRPGRRTGPVRLPVRRPATRSCSRSTTEGNAVQLNRGPVRGDPGPARDRRHRSAAPPRRTAICVDRLDRHPTGDGARPDPHPARDLPARRPDVLPAGRSRTARRRSGR